MFGKGVVLGAAADDEVIQYPHVYQSQGVNQTAGNCAHSGSTWTPILIQSEHLFWNKLNTDSGFKLNTFLDFPE